MTGFPPMHRPLPPALTPHHDHPGRRRALAAGLASVAALCSPSIGRAQAWPTRPLRIVVVYPSGGVSDSVARLIAPRLAERLGTQVVVENKGGAGGSIGMDAVAKSTDAHTLAFAAVSPITLNPHIMKLPYEPLSELVPLASVMISPVYLLGTPLFSGRSFADVLSQARAKPGALRVATSGVASVGHIMVEQLRDKARIDLTHVPYKGGGQVITDAVGGQFELFTTNPSSAVNPLVDRGTLRLLAVAAPKRLESHPETPTFTELGYPDANLMSTFGFFAPASMPRSAQQRIHEDINRLLAQPDLRQKLIDFDNLPAPLSQADFGALVKREFEANARIVKSANIRAD